MGLAYILIGTRWYNHVTPMGFWCMPCDGLLQSWHPYGIRIYLDWHPMI